MNHQDLLETKILGKEFLGDDGWVVRLEKKSHFTPGQVVGITSSPEVPLRYYSFSGASTDKHWEILFKVVPEGKITTWLAGAAEGTRVFCTPPQGTFIQRPGPAVWIAGGTGVAPFLSMTRTGLHHSLIQGGKTLGTLYFHEFFREKLGADYHPCCSTEEAEGVPRRRLMDYLKSINWDPAVNHYICGSATMVVEVRDLLIARGIPYEQIYSEIYF